MYVCMSGWGAKRAILAERRCKNEKKERHAGREAKKSEFYGAGNWVRAGLATPQAEYGWGGKTGHISREALQKRKKRAPRRAGSKKVRFTEQETGSEQVWQHRKRNIGETGKYGWGNKTDHISRDS